MKSYIFKNAKLVDFSGERVGDLIASDGIITSKIDKNIHYETIECKDMILMPSMIDVFDTLSSQIHARALKGGISTIISKTHVENLDTIKSVCATTLEDKMANISILCDKSDAKCMHVASDISSNLMVQIALYAKMLDIPLICLCQDNAMKHGVVNPSKLSSQLGLPSISPLFETKEVAKMSEITKTIGIKAIFEKLAYPNSIEMIDNSDIYKSVSIHHLLLSEEEYKDYNTKAKIVPPLLTQSDMDKMIKLLKSGKIDILSSGFSEVIGYAKDQVFEMASDGIDCLEYYFSILFTYLHQKHQMSLSDISKLTSYNIAKALKLNCGSLESGKEAKLILIDPRKTLEVKDTLSPYHAKKLHGVVINTF